MDRRKPSGEGRKNRTSDMRRTETSCIKDNVDSQPPSAPHTTVAFQDRTMYPSNRPRRHREILNHCLTVIEAKWHTHALLTLFLLPTGAFCKFNKTSPETPVPSRNGWTRPKRPRKLLTTTPLASFINKANTLNKAVHERQLLQETCVHDFA